jgi:hypothetical protein
MRQIGFQPFDRPAKRAEQMIEINECLIDHEKRIGVIEKAGGITPPPSGYSPDPGDPGDLTVYFDNGLI